MNRRQLRERAKLLLAIPEAGDGLLPDGKIDDLFAQALQRFSNAADWPWLLTSAALSFASVTGQATLPTGFMKARVLTIDGYPARYVVLPDFIDATGRDYTYCWTIAATQAMLQPIPNATTAGTLWYYQEEPALADDADSPLCPDRLIEIVIAYAVHLAYLVRQDTNRAQVMFAEYEQALKDAADDLRQSMAPHRVRERTRQTVYARWG